MRYSKQELRAIAKNHGYTFSYFDNDLYSFSKELESNKKYIEVKVSENDIQDGSVNSMLEKQITRISA